MLIVELVLVVCMAGLARRRQFRAFQQRAVPVGTWQAMQRTAAWMMMICPIQAFDRLTFEDPGAP
eukprot:3968389-Prymnesium_polylepis.1